MLQMANVNLDGSLYNQKTNRSWMRDSGPIVIKTEQREALNFNFNGWAKYKTSNWTNIFLRQWQIFLIFHLLK
jgi:agmatine/peptidylarginine deiminase